MVSFHIGVDLRLEGENRQIADGKKPFSDVIVIVLSLMKILTGRYTVLSPSAEKVDFNSP